MHRLDRAQFQGPHGGKQLEVVSGIPLHGRRSSRGRAHHRPARPIAHSGGGSVRAGSDSGGRAWRFGDDIDTDVLAPGLYMKWPIEELASHCLEAVDADFPTTVEPGEFVVAGRNFGIGSSREQAVQALKHLGITAVLARSFAGIFYRNALNLGLPAVVCDATETIAAGDRLRIDLAVGKLENLTQDAALACETIPKHLLGLVLDGGLVPHLEKLFAAKEKP